MKLLHYLTSLLVMPVLILTTVWAMLHPAFLILEYNTPGFPEDSYGFTKAERLYWARYAVDYLRNDADISYLADLRFPDGQQVPPQSCVQMDDCARLYNERELQHMVDVKHVVRQALAVWQVSLLMLLVLGVWYWRSGRWDDFRRAVARGGLWTTGFSGFIIIFVLVGFGVIFVAFHEIFFASGTWMFYYSDTLIRLFPERFWRDAFLLVAGIPALVGFLLYRWAGVRRGFEPVPGERE